MQTQTIQFQFDNVTLEKIDLDLLIERMNDTMIDTNIIDPFANKGYYIVEEVARAWSIIVITVGKNNEKIDIDVELDTMPAEISIKKSKDGRIVFSGKSIAFGVVLYELIVDKEYDKKLLLLLHPNRAPVGGVLSQSLYKDTLMSIMPFITPLSGSDLLLEESKYREKRFVNVWLKDKLSGQSLSVDQKYILGLNIGYKKIGSIVSEDAEVIDSLSKKVGRIELMVYMASQDFMITPRHSMLTLPTSGDSETLNFSIIPKHAGEKNEITIFIYYKLNLIQGISVPLVVEKTTKSIKSLHQQDKFGLNTRVVLSAADGLNTIFNLASRE